MKTIRPQSRRPAFTLLELLLAIAIAGIVAAVLYSSLGVAFRTRELASEDLSAQAIAHEVFETLHADLVSVPPPRGVFAGSFIGSDEQLADGRTADTIACSTTSRQLAGGELTAGFTRVTYEVAEPDELDVRITGTRLVRTSVVNLLASSEPESTTHTLARRVASFNVTYFDGDAWQDEWDSTQQNDTLPQAIAVELSLLPSARTGEDDSQYIDDYEPVTFRRVFTLLAGSTQTQREEEVRGGG